MATLIGEFQHCRRHKLRQISSKNSYKYTGSPPLTRFFGPEKKVLKENCAIGGVF